MTDSHKIANAKLSAGARLNLLATFEQTEEVSQRWCREISNCVGAIIVIGRGLEMKFKASTQEDMRLSQQGVHLFRARKRRQDRYGKYDALPVEIRHHKTDGTILVFANDGRDRFSVYPDELVHLDKPIHGPGRYYFDDNGVPRK